MQGDFIMFRAILFLTSVCGIVRSSGVVPVAPVANGPVVTAASSQYFERTYNRLVAAPPALQPVIPVAPAPPVFIDEAKTIPVAVTPAQNEPVQPNVAIAIATAHAAAPVATILLPPYPFGLPPGIGFVAPEQPNNVPDDKPREPTTTTQSTRVQVKTTVREPEATTPVPASSDNNFVQALPSNQNVNFKQYYAPPLPLLNQAQQWQQHPQSHHQPHLHYNQPQHVQPRPQLVPRGRPQKLKTSVEIVPVPLAYIAPPPLTSHQAIKVVKYIHAFVPTTRAKLIIKPVSSPLRIRSVSSPVRLVTYTAPLIPRNIVARPQNIRSSNSRETEPTTFSPFPRPNTKPPRV